MQSAAGDRRSSDLAVPKNYAPPVRYSIGNKLPPCYKRIDFNVYCLSLIRISKHVHYLRVQLSSST